MKSTLVFFLAIIVATAAIKSEKKSIKDFQKYVLQQDFAFKNDILDDIGHIIKIAVPTEAVKYKAEYPCIWTICKPLEVIKNSDLATKQEAKKILEQLIKFYNKE